WLREWVNPQVDTEALVEQLTMAGLEVDAVESVAGEFTKVVVGQIAVVEAHPDAEKLRVCHVKGGADELTIVVCGASNARVGLKVPFATVGARLPEGLKIKKAKLRGVESFGMLCGQTELKAGDDDSGLWELPADAPVGQDLREYLNLDDKIIEVDLTPNRSDCLGIKGIAREVGVINKVDVSDQKTLEAAVTSTSKMSVEIQASQSCPLYSGRYIEGVNPQAETPNWMQEKLRRSDIRPIDAIVDVTNYVLLELGQPMHAFDADKIDTKICVRHAKSGEKLELLNDQEIELREGSLVISDASKALALAGVMGGASTAVSASSTNIFLEAAFFEPTSIAGKARSYGLHTDSSHRFERGVDPQGVVHALERATQLIIDIAGGRVGEITLEKGDLDAYINRKVTLKLSNIERRLGFAIPKDEVLDILTRLGLTLESEEGDTLGFLVPSYRFDISIEADLLEELARIYGYNRLPTTSLLIPQKLPLKSDTALSSRDYTAHLVSTGYQEVITYSFIDPDMQALFSQNVEQIEVLNPISADMAVMRESLIPGLVECLIYNVNRQVERVKIFELGLSFEKKDDAYVQPQRIAGLIYGNARDQSWEGDKSRLDFYDLKGDVESLLSLTKGEIEFSACDDISYLHPGQSAKVSLNGSVIGSIGALHPALLNKLSLNTGVYIFELDLSKLLKTELPIYSGVSRFPQVGRDLAFTVDAELSVNKLEKVIKEQAGEALKQLKVFDIYSGEGIDSERKSVAFNLTFQHSSRTLNEDEINLKIAAIIKALESEFDARLR
ncbi:MAG: phenylalanyl-tRNA synthetase beta chain, partial [Flavobacteriales bacterium]